MKAIRFQIKRLWHDTDRVNDRATRHSQEIADLLRQLGAIDNTTRLIIEHLNNEGEINIYYDAMESEKVEGGRANVRWLDPLTPTKQTLVRAIIAGLPDFQRLIP